jgi:hypothetical protein
VQRGGQRREETRMNIMMDMDMDMVDIE